MKNEQENSGKIPGVDYLIYSLDRAFRLTSISPSLKTYLGFQSEKLIGRPLADAGFLSLDSMDQALADAGRVFSGETIPPAEYRFISREGKVRFGAVESSPRYRQGVVVEVVSVVWDITGKKLTEKTHRESEELNRIILSEISDAIVITDDSGRIILAAGNVEAVFRISAEEARQKGKLAKLLGSEGGTDRVKLEKAGEILTLEKEIVNAAGERRVLLITVKQVNIRGGTVLYCCRDITERKRAEEDFRSAAAELQTTFDTMSDLVMVVDPQYRVARANQALAEALNLPLAKILGKPCHQMVHGTDRPPEYCPHTRAIQEGQESRTEAREERLNGDFLITANPMFSGTGCLFGTVCVMHDISGIRKTEEALKKAALETLKALSQLVEASDPYTAGHSSRVTDLSIKIAREMGLSPEDIEILRVAGFLHDLGKIGIPGSVLNKPTRLTQAERIMIQSHPVVSAQTSEGVEAFKAAVPVIRHHHERWDGTGYPSGLKGEGIPRLARILAVADSLDAMLSERPYRRQRTEDEAIKELEKGTGSQWDPGVVQVALKIMKAQAEI
ncbi:MAG: PAS domain S-box protein [bacterium]|nr:PAS domain S-box protein [bacterium]